MVPSNGLEGLVNDGSRDRQLFPSFFPSLTLSNQKEGYVDRDVCWACAGGEKPLFSAQGTFFIKKRLWSMSEFASAGGDGGQSVTVRVNKEDRFDSVPLCLAYPRLPFKGDLLLLKSGASLEDNWSWPWVLCLDFFFQFSIIECFYLKAIWLRGPQW